MRGEAEKVFDFITSNNIATYDECLLVSKICGYSVDTLNKIIYVRTGYHSVRQLLNEKPEFYKDYNEDFNR